jgi:hypothetical protein
LGARIVLSASRKGGAEEHWKMALTAKSVKDVQGYFQGVVARAEHHAINVTEVIYPLLGLIILHLDSGSDIKVREYNGTPANMLWVQIKGKRYAFRYDHTNDNIEIRDGGLNGAVLHTVDNSNNIPSLVTIFEKL